MKFSKEYLNSLAELGINEQMFRNFIEKIEKGEEVDEDTMLKKLESAIEIQMRGADDSELNLWITQLLNELRTEKARREQHRNDLLRFSRKAKEMLSA